MSASCRASFVNLSKDSMMGIQRRVQRLRVIYFPIYDHDSQAINPTSLSKHQHINTVSCFESPPLHLARASDHVLIISPNQKCAWLKSSPSSRKTSSFHTQRLFNGGQKSAWLSLEQCPGKTLDMIGKAERGQNIPTSWSAWNYLLRHLVFNVQNCL